MSGGGQVYPKILHRRRAPSTLLCGHLSGPATKGFLRRQLEDLDSPRPRHSRPGRRQGPPTSPRCTPSAPSNTPPRPPRECGRDRRGGSSDSSGPHPPVPPISGAGRPAPPIGDDFRPASLRTCPAQTDFAASPTTPTRLTADPQPSPSPTGSFMLMPRLEKFSRAQDPSLRSDAGTLSKRGGGDPPSSGLPSTRHYETTATPSTLIPSETTRSNSRSEAFATSPRTIIPAI